MLTRELNYSQVRFSSSSKFSSHIYVAETLFHELAQRLAWHNLFYYQDYLIRMHIMMKSILIANSAHNISLMCRDQHPENGFGRLHF